MICCSQMGTVAFPGSGRRIDHHKHFLPPSERRSVLRPPRPPRTLSSAFTHPGLLGRAAGVKGRAFERAEHPLSLGSSQEPSVWRTQRRKHGRVQERLKEHQQLLMPSSVSCPGPECPNRSRSPSSVHYRNSEVVAVLLLGFFQSSPRDCFLSI